MFLIAVFSASTSIMALYLFGNSEQLNFDGKDVKNTFCPTQLEKFEFLRTNGITKAGASILENTCSLLIIIRMRARTICSAFVCIDCQGNTWHEHRA